MTTKQDDMTNGDDQFGTHAPTIPPEDTGAPALPSALRVRSYRILDVLGEGSMGVVYRAEQQSPERVVALKVLKAGDAGAEALQRFEREAQMLGRLQHPGIAQIFEAGTADTDGGRRPFLAMELIQGVPLNRYAQRHDLHTRDRLELFIKVCEGVQHAHQKGVIHRDLKPGNILVDERGQPKILDFGIAVATDPTAPATAQTDGGVQLAGTLPYMSAEQLGGNLAELDTRTDVHALGVLLYQLLTGELPFDLKGKSISEAARIVGQGEPTAPGAVDRTLRGDLDAIVLRAIHRDKRQRYQSASDLAADIRRVLSHQPVTARTPTTRYLASKFVRRNKVLVGVVGVVFFTLGIAVIGTAASLGKAVKEADKYKLYFEFWEGVLESVDPANARDRNIPMRQVFDDAAARVEAGDLARQPEVEIAVRKTLGKTFRSLSAHTESERHLTSALTTSRRVLGDTHPQTLTVMNELALTLAEVGRHADAEPLYRAALQGRKTLLGAEHADTLETKHNLALLLKKQGRFDEAEKLYLRVLEARRRVLGPEHPRTLVTMNSLGVLLQAQGKAREAEDLFRQTLGARRTILGDSDPETLKSMNNLATLLRSERRLPEAEALYSEVLVRKRHVLGNEHRDTLTSMNNLALLYKAEGKLDEAEALSRETLDTRRRVLGPTHRKTLASMRTLAAVLQVRGRLDEAEALYRETIRLQHDTLGERNRATVNSMFALAALLADKGDDTEAMALHEKVLRLRRELLPSSHPDTAASLLRLGMILLEQQKPLDAEPLLRECVEIRTDALRTDDWRVANARSVLGECLTALGQFVEAEKLLQESFPIIQAEWGENEYHTRMAQERINRLHEARNRPRDAQGRRDG